MARAVWKGHITFGLVNVPVNLFPAEQRADLQFHLIDSRDHARVRYERVNEETGEEVPWDSVVRGFEYSDGNYVVLSDEELKRAAPEATKSVEIQSFVKSGDIDPIYFDTPYYLEAGKGGEKGYVLLREAMKESGKVGIARVVIRTRQYIAALSPRGDVLMLDLLRYPQEIRSTKELNVPAGSAKSHGVSTQELKIARTLIDAMAADWKPSEYHDTYREQLMKWIEKKIASGSTKKSPAAPEKEEEPATGPINFMEVLKKSLEKSGTKQGRKASPRTAKKPVRRKAG
ncbi:MAG: Ku protein [Phycisphaeraceae bacterium]|nr:Ku protein [Phycisphaeraceae bacterium]